jgi:hypothetical protein
MSRWNLLAICGLLAVCLGCNTSPPDAATSQPAPEAEKYLLASAPKEPQSVKQAKESAEDGEEVTLVGRIGGSVSPFVSGRASFTLVDTSLVPCSERSGDSCKTPWDYCCDTDELPASTAVVKVVDDEGRTIPLDAKTKLGMQELQTVVVRGKAKRDEAGNLTVLAPAVYVKE